MTSSSHPADDPTPTVPGGGPSIGWIAALIAVTALVLGIGAVAAVQGSDGGGDTATTGDDPDEGWNGALLAEPTPRPAFTLTDTQGRPYDFAAETGGRLTLLFFGYTSCPDVCPIHMATLSAALEQPGMPDPIVVFVTTDPERDTPERLRDWLDNFGTDFVGLTGTPEQIAAAEDAAGVARSLVAPGEGRDTGTGAGEYEVGHAAQIIAYTPDDLTHVQYPFGVRRQDWQADLPRMMATWNGRAGDAAGDDGAAADITVGEAWAAADDTISAVYLTVDNTGADDRLIAAASDVAGRVSVMGPGVAMPAEGETEAGTAVDLDIPAGQTVLDPGGTHMMLEQLTRPLVPGEQITVRLTFAAAGEVEVPVDILDWDQVAERAAEQ